MPPDEESNDKPKPHRTKHSEQRRREGRRIGAAFHDAQQARPADVFIQRDGCWIVRGPKAREFIFNEQGDLLTGVDRYNNAHLQALRLGNRRPATSAEFEKFKELFQNDNSGKARKKSN